jgi:hypothetical protein
MRFNKNWIENIAFMVSVALIVAFMPPMARVGACCEWCTWSEAYAKAKAASSSKSGVRQKIEGDKIPINLPDVNWGAAPGGHSDRPDFVSGGMMAFKYGGMVIVAAKKDFYRQMLEIYMNLKVACFPDGPHALAKLGPLTVEAIGEGIIRNQDKPEKILSLAIKHSAKSFPVRGKLVVILHPFFNNLIVERVLSFPMATAPNSKFSAGSGPGKRTAMDKMVPNVVAMVYEDYLTIPCDTEVVKKPPKCKWIEDRINSISGIPCFEWTLLNLYKRNAIGLDNLRLLECLGISPSIVMMYIDRAQLEFSRAEENMKKIGYIDNDIYLLNAYTLMIQGNKDAASRKLRKAGHPGWDMNRLHAFVKKKLRETPETAESLTKKYKGKTPKRKTGKVSERQEGISPPAQHATLPKRDDNRNEKPRLDAERRAMEKEKARLEKEKARLNRGKEVLEAEKSRLEKDQSNLEFQRKAMGEEKVRKEDDRTLSPQQPNDKPADDPNSPPAPKEEGKPRVIMKPPIPVPKKAVTPPPITEGQKEMLDFFKDY